MHSLLYLQLKALTETAAGRSVTEISKKPTCECVACNRENGGTLSPTPAKIIRSKITATIKSSGSGLPLTRANNRSPLGFKINYHDSECVKDCCVLNATRRLEETKACVLAPGA